MHYKKIELNVLVVHLVLLFYKVHCPRSAKALKVQKVHMIHKVHEFRKKQKDLDIHNVHKVLYMVLKVHNLFKVKSPQG